MPQTDADNRGFQAEIAYLRETVDGLSSGYDALQQRVGGILSTQINTPPAPVSNLIYNGEAGHSVTTWFDTVAATDDTAKECAYWFSHDGGEAVTLSDVNSKTSTTNKELKETSHSTYSAAFSRWNSSNGWAELTGTKTLDNLLPSNFIDATTPLARVSLIAAKRNTYIEIPSTSRMYAGIYDNTAGQLKYLTGSLGFKAELVGSAAASTVERRYKIHILSDRGFSVLSPEITIANAPADGFFSSTKNIAMSWKPTAGQLRADIYEYVPSTGIYKQIAEVSSAFSFIHLGTYLARTVTGYPTATDTERKAYFSTRTGEISNLATNQVDSRWNTVNFPIAVPDNYDKSATTGRQWLRIGLTVAANLYVAGCTCDGSTTITAPAAVFESAYATLFAGKTAEILDENGTLLATTTVSSRTNDTQIILGAAQPAGTARILRIVAGGFNAILIDKIHLGFQQNTSYAPNALDNRALQPVAAPTSGTQGGTGEGGSGGGIYICIAGNTPVKQADDTWKRISFCKTGTAWASPEFAPNLLLKLKHNYGNVRGVLSENGCYIEATDTERFVVEKLDVSGTPLSFLRIGDKVLTEVDGRIESSRLAEISDYLGKTAVYTPTLSNSRLFIAGRMVQTTIKQKILCFIRRIFARKTVKGGFVLHNAKHYEVGNDTY